MGKTVEQKLQGAKEEIRKDKKRIKEMERKLYSYQHQVNAKRLQIEKLNAESRIREAELKSAEMFICYLQSLANDDSEVRIPLKDLYYFSTGYGVEWKKDDEKQEIIIRTFMKRESKVGNKGVTESTSDNEG